MLSLYLCFIVFYFILFHSAYAAGPINWSLHSFAEIYSLFTITLENPLGTGLPVRVCWVREKNQYFIKYYESCRDRFTGPCVLGEKTNSIFYKYIFYALREAFCFKFFQFTFFLHFFIFIFYFISIHSAYAAGPINWSLHGFNIQ